MSRRSSRLAWIALIAVACVLAAPAGAVAQNSPFQGLPPATPAAPETTTTQTTQASDDSGLDTWQGALIVAGGLALLTGIGVAIAKDARRRAPVGDPTADAAQHDADAHKRARQSKQRQRQKAKAARAARRRNR